MAPRPVTISTELQFTLVVPGAVSLPVRCGLSYDATDPYAVSVAFHTGVGLGAEVVAWTFARQLLTEGLAGPAGEGDVRVWPATVDGEPAVCLSLTAPSGSAQFEVPVPELVEFLTMTYAAVPTGAESDHIDVQAELALLRWAEPGT